MVLVGSSGNSSERQSTLSIDLLKEETYFVIPTSTGSKLKAYIKEVGNTDSCLMPDGMRDASLTVYCETSFDLEQAEFDVKIHDAAILMPILAGKTINAVQDRVVIYALRGGCAGVSYAAKNISRKPLLLSIDFAHSGEPIVTHKDSLFTSEKLLPGALQYSLSNFFQRKSSLVVSCRRGKDFASYISH